jgi:hypothetical protein
VGAEPLAKLLERHPGVRVGSWLYAAPQPSPWLPIEAAPKDGTEVILRRGDRVAAAMWCEWSGHEEREAGASWSISYDGDGWDDDKAPTHFQYLPAAPGVDAPTAQPSRPDDQPEYTDSEFGFLVDTLNGLTEQETAASASVAGLSGAQPEAPAEPSGWQLNAITHVAAWLGDLQDVPRDASYWTNGRFAADCMDAHDVLLATPAPVAQQPAELTDEQIADAMEREFSASHGWPESDVEIVRAFLKHWPAIKAQGGSQ